MLASDSATPLVGLDLGEIIALGHKHDSMGIIIASLFVTVGNCVVGIGHCQETGYCLQRKNTVMP